MDREKVMVMTHKAFQLEFANPVVTRPLLGHLLKLEMWADTHWKSIIDLYLSKQGLSTTLTKEEK